MTEDVSPSGEEHGENLAQILKEARLRLGWSQAKVAAHVGVTEVTVWRWENDGSIPRGDDVQETLIKVLQLPENIFETMKKKQERQEKKPLPVNGLQVIEKLSDFSRLPKDSPLFSILLARLPNDIELPPPNMKDMIEGGRRLIVYRGRNTHGDEDVGRGFVMMDNTQLGFFDDWNRYESKGTSLHTWGYGGEGPRILAGSILYTYFKAMFPHIRDEALCVWASKYTFDFYAYFVFRFSKKPDEGWELSSHSITSWLEQLIAFDDPPQWSGPPGHASSES